MNCVRLFLDRARERPNHVALWLPSEGVVRFGELAEAAASCQKFFLSQGLKAGDSVLVLENLSPRLYACILGLLGLGACVVFVEPWMKVERVEKALNLVKPKFFVAGAFGKLWGLRVPAVRRIPHWVSTKTLVRENASDPFRAEDVDAQLPGILTFTSGTTGTPKGVVRAQKFLEDSHRVLSKALGDVDHAGPDLCIFANFALSNLAAGRASLLVPKGWKHKDLARIEALGGELRPETVTCGPAFLRELFKTGRWSSLKSLHVGGALTDCWIFDEVAKRWPDAHAAHVYGSTEAEPVALMDAQEAVRRSREAGYFQTLCLGRPVPEITAQLEADTVWVTGPHVAPAYLGGETDNAQHKRRDGQGRVWHSMGDRVREREGCWWYTGRAGQAPELFELEQKIYARLESSASFLQNDREGRTWWIGQGLSPEKRARLEREFPMVQGYLNARIQRDPRHRARLDRKSTTETLPKSERKRFL